MTTRVDGGPRTPGRSMAALAITYLALLVTCGGGPGDSSGRGSGSALSTASASTSTTATPEPTTADPSAVPGHLRGKDVTEIPTGDRVVALTFDAGADAAGLPSILGTLADQQVPATFFLTGRWVDDHPQDVAVIHAAGHRLGNHSTTHPHFTALPDQAIRDEVQGAEQRILAAGADPRPLFRFPFGDRDERTIAAVNDLGYVAVRWTVDTLGWKGTSGGMSAQEVADRAVDALRPGEIVLMHLGSNPEDGTTLDADALPDVIERMRAAGYTFVTLDALLTAEDRRSPAAG
ncbi:polysaccharide deacetylase family protein [Geodermatophilus poikilotrophus]|uniref:Peptidoglycan/xylan/chitin deacetylase, PgdA/CDA1 family n=1 Tax=Geodermatophilus poikilotrophus TaxID=1333667 RepID=A0A1H9YH65_9ACTN|nr:polysaccharide deacetylase family protein [Geodermatophilus poikilotrophus]SES68278.1 Peptidoglycan/xylan/chitin deacetylase, PgdA/CDA1 family [Geodermatophilus poikilotrophus]